MFSCIIRLNVKAFKNSIVIRFAKYQGSILCISTKTSLTQTEIIQAMEDAGLIPTLIAKQPKSILSVKFTHSGKEVCMGNELTPTEVKDQPAVQWNIEDENAYYTLLMVDPDAPSRRFCFLGEVKHWLVGNIVSGSGIENGETIAEYTGSGPPKHTGLHRYVFLLYKHLDRINFEEPFSAANSRKNRLRFSTKSFARKYNLGEPIAGNFYVSQWDSYVDIRNKEVTGCSIM